MLQMFVFHSSAKLKMINKEHNSSGEKANSSIMGQQSSCLLFISLRSADSIVGRLTLLTIS